VAWQGDVRVLRTFWKTKPAEVAEAPSPTPTDREAQAYATWKAAEIVLADACMALNRFRLTHPQHVPVKRIGNDTWIQQTPNDPQLLALSSAENRARFDRDQKQQAWSLLHKQLHPDMAHVGGVKVQP
jgi:hypothetical protein